MDSLYINPKTDPDRYPMPDDDEQIEKGDIVLVVEHLKTGVWVKDPQSPDANEHGMRREFVRCYLVKVTGVTERHLRSYDGKMGYMFAGTPVPGANRWEDEAAFCTAFVADEPGEWDRVAIKVGHQEPRPVGIERRNLVGNPGYDLMHDPRRK